MSCLSHQYSSNLSVQNVSFVYLPIFKDNKYFLYDFNYLALLYPNELGLYTVDEFLKKCDESHNYSSAEKNKFHTLDTSTDSDYLRLVNYLDSKFYLKKDSKLKCRELLSYHEYKQGYEHHMSFYFFDSVEVNEVREIRFSGVPNGKTRVCALYKDDLIADLSSYPLKQVTRGHVHLYYKDSSGYGYSADSTVFEYSDKLLIVIPIKFIVDFTRYKYVITAKVFEIPIKKCCLMECFGITE